MHKPQAALLDGGRRLHLQHGPIDLIIGADPVEPGERRCAFMAAQEVFGDMLEGLVAELPTLRAPLTPTAPRPMGRVARRMHAAALPHCADSFITRMAAVAGSVADEVLAAMESRVALRRAYVNNGGDIAVHLMPGARFDLAMAGVDGTDLGRVRIAAGQGIGGIATSGTGGRSLSLGIADSVTVLAASAAAADGAATLIANAVDLPGHPAIQREPACHLDPDSDLGARLAVTGVGFLPPDDCRAALDAGMRRAAAMHDAGRIAGAALFLRGERALVGAGLVLTDNTTERVA